MTDADHQFIAKCKWCGMKVTVTGDLVNNNMCCQHLLIPMTPTHGLPRALRPSWIERESITKLNKNNAENNKNINKLKSAANELVKLKLKALQDIEQYMSRLHEQLDKRSEILQRYLNDAFHERQNEIFLSTKQLNDHKDNIEHTIYKTEEMLLSSSNNETRENNIAQMCETVFSWTPDIAFFKPQLRFNFPLASFIEMEIGKFGELTTKTMDMNKMSKYLVFGYFREAQSLFVFRSVFHNIPDSLSIICLSYYGTLLNVSEGTDSICNKRKKIVVVCSYLNVKKKFVLKAKNNELNDTYFKAKTMQRFQHKNLKPGFEYKTLDGDRIQTFDDLVKILDERDICNIELMIVE
eukprot:155891_1